MRIAALADIHGNSLALEAVLGDIDSLRADVLINLGDALNGPIDPPAVLRMLRSRPFVHIRGNGDRMVTEGDGPAVSDTARFARARISEQDLRYVASWPATVAGDGWFAFHGSPGSDTEYLLEKVGPEAVTLRTTGEILPLVAGVSQTLLLCGHTHIPRIVGLPDGRVVVNPGSVGLPAYRDDAPFPHKMETGSPHARYAVIEEFAGAWRVSLRAIAYDWERAARMAAENGREDWSGPVGTGYA